MFDKSKSNKDSKVTITFPCPNYPIKIIGLAVPDFQHVLTQVLKHYIPGYTGKMNIKKSHRATFLSSSISVRIEDKKHLEKLYQALKDIPFIKIIL